jgi:DNA-binding GntR family transcriptional regulator
MTAGIDVPPTRAAAPISDAPEAAGAGQAAPRAIAAQLRREILRGAIPGGERILQDAVATRFGVSQNTVREAFKQLESEGFLRSEPRRGVSVVPLSVTEAWEITELRMLLEVQALEWALPRLDAAYFDAATAVLDQLDRARAVDEVIDLNSAFHRHLYGPADRERTLALIETLRLNFERYLRLTWEETGHLARSQREHREILRLCREGDHGGATAVLREHIRGTGQLLVQHLEREAKYPKAIKGV